VEDSGFAAGTLQKGLLVQGRTIRPGPLRIWSDAREAEGQSVWGVLSFVTFFGQAKKVTRLSYAVAGETPLN
jgi:hypothetical protein